MARVQCRRNGGITARGSHLASLQHRASVVLQFSMGSNAPDFCPAHASLVTAEGSPQKNAITGRQPLPEAAATQEHRL
jgi:hypothetical protein